MSIDMASSSRTARLLFPVFVLCGRFPAHTKQKREKAVWQRETNGVYVLHANAISTRTWFYVNKIIILEVHKAKMNWLQALLAVNEILLKAIPGKTEIVILEQQLSLLLNFNSGT